MAWVNKIRAKNYSLGTETGPALKSRSGATFVLLFAMASSAVLSVTGSDAVAASAPPVPYDPVAGQALVSKAKQIMLGGSPWTGGCVPNTGGLHCVPYSWGGGHGPQPGPADVSIHGVE
jgi:hypothetical protein